MAYKPTIGLEIHAELKTRTKMFCSCLNDPDEKHPNLNICPVCLGHPGTLPVINKEALDKTILTGLALNCRIARETHFDRKNYFYPDLPKGYQISQYQAPLCTGGWLEINGKKTRINRVHLEEDAGRLQHDRIGKHSLVDFNRAGVPLMELVTEPDLSSGEEVEEFAKKLRLILRYLGVSEANMEKGEMRVEVNISLSEILTSTNRQPPTANRQLGDKVEVKNLNSIRAAVTAVDYEIRRQTELLKKGKKVSPETRGWDENKQETFSQRSKEEAHDYRYFPEPDLPVLRFTDSDIEKIHALIPELPDQRKKRFKEAYNLNSSQIEIFTVAKRFGDYYEKVASEIDAWAETEHQGKSKAEIEAEPHLAGRLHALAANYMITEFPPLMSAQGLEIDELEGFKITPEKFAELMVMIFHKRISSAGAKAALKEMAETGRSPEQIVKEKNLEQLSDEGELRKIVEEVIAQNPSATEDYKKGKTESLKFLVGKAMAATKGKANPQTTAKLLMELLNF